MTGLSFITLLAYDYRYAFKSLRSYYDIADEILLGVDVGRLTWMRRPFEFNRNEVDEFIASIDTAGKIRLVEDNYHVYDDPMRNDVHERSALSLLTRPENWVVQIDADEILLNAAEFRQWLLQTDPVAFDVYAQWITVFKIIGDHALVIDPPGEPAPVATRLRGQYMYSRQTPQRGFMSPLKILHYSWGRSREELLQKLDNWGHSGDFDAHRFLEFWDSLDLQNYTRVRDFHPLHGAMWRALKLVPVGRRSTAEFL